MPMKTTPTARIVPATRLLSVAALWAILGRVRLVDSLDGDSSELSFLLDHPSKLAIGPLVEALIGLVSRIGVLLSDSRKALPFLVGRHHRNRCRQQGRHESECNTLQPPLARFDTQNVFWSAGRTDQTTELRFRISQKSPTFSTITDRRFLYGYLVGFARLDEHYHRGDSEHGRLLPHHRLAEQSLQRKRAPCTFPFSVRVR